LFSWRRSHLCIEKCRLLVAATPAGRTRQPHVPPWTWTPSTTVRHRTVPGAVPGRRAAATLGRLGDDLKVDFGGRLSRYLQPDASNIDLRGFFSSRPMNFPWRSCDTSCETQVDPPRCCSSDSSRLCLAARVAASPWKIHRPRGDSCSSPV
jgi:hypothetical protein